MHARTHCIVYICSTVQHYCTRTIFSTSTCVQHGSGVEHPASAKLSLSAADCTAWHCGRSHEPGASSSSSTRCWSISDYWLPTSSDSDTVQCTLYMTPNIQKYALQASLEGSGLNSSVVLLHSSSGLNIWITSTQLIFYSFIYKKHNIISSSPYRLSRFRFSNDFVYKVVFVCI